MISFTVLIMTPVISQFVRPTNVRKIGRFKARTIKGLTQCGLLIKA